MDPGEVHRNVYAAQTERRGNPCRIRRTRKYDDIPERAFYMKGDIEEVLATAEKLKASV
ncbi:MAG: hypothetical protein ABSD44_03710 [Terracidiphilus sp.]